MGISNWQATPVGSVYVHVPFCVQRCGYCDFAIVAGRSDLVPAYLAALEREISVQAQHIIYQQPLKTLFIGGGTPTLLSEKELEQFFRILQRHFMFNEETELTVEANPDQFTSGKQQLLKQHGVNRVSLGLQSFDDKMLYQLDRTHSADLGKKVLSQLQQTFANVSVDLIFALPGQTLRHWQQTLQEAVELQPNHISTYGLTIEKGTRFWGLRNKSLLETATAERESEMYVWSVDYLRDQGFQQYEISNFCQPGYHSRHNDAYWTGESYAAFGPGASRFLNGQRVTNHRSIFTWLKQIDQTGFAVAETDGLTPEQRARELLAIGLRRTAGISLEQIEQLCRIRLSNLLDSEAEELIGRDWLEISGQNWKLTSAGRLFADEVAAMII